MNTDFTKFINEVQYLDIKTINNRLTLEHNSDSDISNYEAEIENLQQAAINELLDRNPQQIKQHLVRLKRIKRVFSKAIENGRNAHKKFKDDTLTETELKRLFEALIIPNHKPANITEQFLVELNEALMFKHGALLGFEDQIKEVLQMIEASDNGQEIPKPDYAQATNLFREIMAEINKGIKAGNISDDDDVIEIFRSYKTDFQKSQEDKKYIKRYAQYDDKNKIGICRALERIFNHKFKPQVGRAESIKTHCDRHDIWDA